MVPSIPLGQATRYVPGAVKAIGNYLKAVRQIL
jgi:hypothetical protein